MKAPDYTKAPYANTADGRTYEYRRAASYLERRDLSSLYWNEVTGQDFRAMTPADVSGPVPCAGRKMIWRSANREQRNRSHPTTWPIASSRSESWKKN